MPRYESDRLCVVAVRERDTRIRRDPVRGRNARHDLKWNPLFGEGFNLLTAAPEDEGIAAFDPQHPFALARQLHHQRVDILLRQRVVVALFADINPLRVLAHQVHDGVRHQGVMQYDVRLLHQTQCAKGQQIRISGARAHQIDLTHRTRLGCTIQRGLQIAFRDVLLTGKHALCYTTFEHVFPEDPASRASGQAVLDPVAVARGKVCQAAVRGGNQRFEPRAHHPGQHGRGAATRNRDDERRAVKYRGHDEGAEGGAVDHVDGDPQILGRARNRSVDRVIVRGGDRERRTRQMMR